MTQSATILLVDADAAGREATARVLREAGHRVIVVGDGQEALDRAAAERPDVVILETALPGVGGLEVCRGLKREDRRELVPVLFLATRADAAARVEGLRAGAEDFVAKPADAEELRARVESLLRIKRTVDEAVRGRLELEETSLHDRLTGLHNESYLAQRLDEEFRRAERYNEPLSVMAMGLDDLTRHGRELADRLLASCARTLARSCRRVDVLTRGEGDELVLVMPNTHFAGSLVFAERLWREVRATAVVADDGPARISCTASVGVACYPNRDVNSAKDLLKFAHLALARARAEGQGQICVYQHQGYLFQPR